MARRRRLDVTAVTAGAPEVKAAGAGVPPIATVAGQSAALAAAESVVAEIATARAEGRLAQAIPVAAVVADYLVRDRLAVDDEEMAALKASLAAHGQRTPIEVVALAAGSYGLISGFRRLSALRDLQAETVLAVLRQPGDAGAAYVSMVEENEIRVGLSHYERGRIAALAAEQGVFATADAAVDALFASASKAKRSKIRAFQALHEALGDLLRFPAALNERLGLKLAQAVREGRGGAVRRALAEPAPDAATEVARLAAAVSHAKPGAVDRGGPAEEIAPGVRAELGRGRLVLKGKGVDAEFLARLRAALAGSS